MDGGWSPCEKAKQRGMETLNEGGCQLDKRRDMESWEQEVWHPRRGQRRRQQDFHVGTAQ